MVVREVILQALIALINHINEHAKDTLPLLQCDFLAPFHAAYTIDEVHRQSIEARLRNFCADQVDELHFVGWRFAGSKDEG